MSRTDKTNPWYVKQHYEHNFLEPTHRHEFHDCDLPERPNPKHDRYLMWTGKRDGHCFWYPSLEFMRSRWAKCSCNICRPPGEDWWFGPKKQRRAGKRYARDGWRDEY